MCCGPPSDAYNKRRIPTMASNPFYATRTSVLSNFRRGSSISVLSERRPSYQYGKRCSDASIISDRRESCSGTDFRKEMVFSPIHEHNEEMTQCKATIHLENLASHKLEYLGSKEANVSSEDQDRDNNNTYDVPNV